MYTKDQVFHAITISSFVKIEDIMYRVDGHIIEDEEKMVYLLHEDSGEELIYMLEEKEDMKALQAAEFYELKNVEFSEDLPFKDCLEIA